MDAVRYALVEQQGRAHRLGGSHLTKLLEEIIDEEKSRQRFTAGSERGLPTEAAPPQGGWHDSAQLGTLDADALTVRTQTRFSGEQLLAKAEAEMRRRAEAGISDAVGWQQPPEAPPFSQDLVGKRLEVLWKYHDKNTQEAHYIWCSGTVKQIADGLTDKRSKRARTILPGGAVLWAWDADPDFDEAAGEQCAGATAIQVESNHPQAGLQLALRST